MLIAYWAAKGGSGTSVVAAAEAVRAAAVGPTLLVDLDGDQHRILATSAPQAGAAEWLAAGAAVPADALDRIAVPVGPNLRLVGRGFCDLDAARAPVLADLLARSARTVIVDCGTRPVPAARAVARAADRSVLVTRSCYLAVRRAEELDLAPTEVVLVEEQQRALAPDDLASSLRAPIRAVVPVHPSIARAVDCGLLATRLPRRLSSALGGGRLRRAS